MAHPKRKISKTRRDKRRTHYKASDQQIATCSKTGERIYIIVLIGMKENFIIEEKFLSTLIKQQKSSQFNKH